MVNSHDTKPDQVTYELHVKPTYAVYIPQRTRHVKQRTVAQILNDENLKLARNRQIGAGEEPTQRNQLSAKAVRRLTNACNWLVASASKKQVFEKSTGKRFWFKINFVTLTLPGSGEEISDYKFKSVLIHNFINTLRASHGLNQYVWKVEAQENGAIHAHFTTDTFIHWQDLRNVWNRILEKNGLLESYQAKHSAMSFEDYCNEYNPTGTRDIEAMRKAFEFGQKTNWKSPNSTDVHSVWKVNDIGAYLAKYMGKNEEDRREIKGRLWGSSQHLSDSNKLVIEMQSVDDFKQLAPLYSPEIESKSIEVVNKLAGNVYVVGYIFFFKLRDWGKIITGNILTEYNRHLFGIRHALNLFASKVIEVADFLPPIELQPITRCQENGRSNQLNIKI